MQNRYNAMLLKTKAVSLHGELMCMRSLFGKPDMGQQGRLSSGI
ncbi:MAG: hypothetical protein AAFO87_02250 [Cyanobacteria bacterium J06607_6]